MSVQARDVAQEFGFRFGRMPKVSRAPGRVNLIGEHTDCNDGFVMPAALDFATLTAAAPRPDQRLAGIRRAETRRQPRAPSRALRVTASAVGHMSS